MSSKATKRRGRPSIADASVTIRVDEARLKKADTIAADLDRMIAGMSHTRMDILRAALSRGLDDMRADVDARMGAKR